MKTTKILLILTSILFNVLASAVIAQAVELPLGVIFPCMTVLSLVPMPQGVLSMAITKEIWLNDIVANLFKSNPHLNFAMNADQFVLAGKVVHIPNAGAKPGVERNRSKLPATVLKRNDIDITFPLDEFTSDPILIDNAENYELSYDKRASVMGEQVLAISELVGDWFFRYWAPTVSAQITRTEGSNATAHYGSGDRKAVKLEDVKKIQKLMNTMSIPQEGRYGMLDAEMMDQFTSSLSASQYRDFVSIYDAKNGIIGRIFGITFLDPRATVLRYDNSSTPAPKNPGSAEASTDNGAGLFWQKDMVIRALGNNEFFENEKDPTYYGDIYSVLVRAGGRIKRWDEKGVIALVQDAGTQ